MAMTSASHAEGRQFDPGQVYVFVCSELVVSFIADPTFWFWVENVSAVSRGRLASSDFHFATMFSEFQSFFPLDRVGEVSAVSCRRTARRTSVFSDCWLCPCLILACIHLFLLSKVGKVSAVSRRTGGGLPPVHGPQCFYFR